MAAYAVVNSSNQEGLQLLMKFCSTSRGLMGSQMILTFITAMSKKMGKVIQRKIQDFVSSWTSDDDISPKDRVSFLITMLKENKSLEFPLPETIHINLREYDTFMGGLNQAILHLFNRKTTIERFFSMDSRGVKHVKIAVGKSNRFELIKTNNLEELEVDFENTYSKEDEKQIINIIKYNNKLCILNMFNLTDPLTLLKHKEFIQIITSSINLNVHLGHIGHLTIDKDIATVISQIHDNIDIDLSGNEITQMEAGLLGKVLKYMKKQEKINIYDWGITIDVDIVKALSNMVYLEYLGLSYNTLTTSASKCLSESVRSLPQLVYLGLARCDISNDDCVDLVSSLSKHCQRLRELYLYKNHLSSGYSQVVDDVSKMNNLRWLGLDGNPCMEDRKKREEIKNRLKISNPQLTVW